MHAAYFNDVGEYIECKSSISYLGALLDSSGSIQSELARRIGMATADFKALSRIWNHTSVTKELKYRIYQACIVSKLLYGLQVAWLTKTQRLRLDGFHARCVRKIVEGPHSFWSRISNADVLEKSMRAHSDYSHWNSNFYYLGKSSDALTKIS